MKKIQERVVKMCTFRQMRIICITEGKIANFSVPFSFLGFFFKNCMWKSVMLDKLCYSQTDLRLTLEIEPWLFFCKSVSPSQPPTPFLFFIMPHLQHNKMKFARHSSGYKRVRDACIIC